jgi:hypothetical protein
METKDLIDAILLKNETIPRTGGAESACALITRCQNKLFSKASNNSIYVDPLTGLHPFLPIVADQNAYDIPGVQMMLGGIDRDIAFSKCLEAYIEDSAAVEYGISDLLSSWLRKDWIEKVEDRYILPIHSFERVGGNTNATPARIIFKRKPEESDAELVHHISLIQPLPVTDDSIPLSVNEQWDEALIDGVLGSAEYYQYGNSDRLQTFNDYWCNKFWEAADSMPRINKVKATPRRRF